MIVNQSAPAATVVPILIYADVARAIDWLKDAFGFSERLRAGRGGVVSHAQLIVGDGALMVAVEGVDEHFERAKRAGARIVEAPHDTPFGERQYTAEDPEGHRWTFSQHVADVPPERWGATLAVS